ncbi:hypothetical protein PROSTU_01788 [Providencia stuartii ATCC 25827]|uniref:Uncharacterized protein n=1 Tax=Providencia stuartii ATCC 25827 TaxID=471874 RepID=A0AA86YHI3_PROST|nr:hypothetical protein PROSTU_01788 [Providencia stuartii ATCC 25827]
MYVVNNGAAYNKKSIKYPNQIQAYAPCSPTGILLIIILIAEKL